jgi:hypothetical protein
MKFQYRILTLSTIAVAALSLAMPAQAAEPPAPRQELAITSVATNSAPGSLSITNPAPAEFSAQLALLDLIGWRETMVSAVLLAFAACAFLPKCYRSIGAFMRYLAKLMRDPFERFCMRLRFFLRYRLDKELIVNRALAIAIVAACIMLFVAHQPVAALVVLFAAPACAVLGRPQLCDTATGKLAAVTSQPMVREYAQGAAQGAMEQLAVASFLAPNVPVAGMIGRFKRYNQKHRFRLPKTRRVLGGAATQIGFTADDALYQANANALDFPIDNLEKLEGAELVNVVNEASDMVSEVAALAWESEVVNAGLAALGNGTDLTWDAGTDPVRALDNIILATLKAAKSGSMMGVRVLFGATAWLIFKNHPKVTGKFTNNPKGGTNPQVTRPMASSLLLTEPEIQTTYSVYDTAPEGVSESISFLLDSKIIVFACKPKPTRLDPSFMKTFAPRGQFMVPGTYPLQDQRGEVVKFDWNCVAEVTNEDAGTLLNIAES